MNKQVVFQDLGIIGYQKAWDLQEKLFADIIQQKIHNRNFTPENQQATINHLLFCEHPHVYTLGKSGKIDHLLLDESGLSEHEASFYKTNRGGDITYHGNGQLVGYPILDLDNFFNDIHRYMRNIEEAIIRTCAEYGVVAGRIDGLTGVWIDYETQANPRKICAMGVKSSRWVTMHGFALNINTDLSYFNHIVPCGIQDKAVTSLEKELGSVQNFKEVSEKVLVHLGNLFGMEIV